MKKIFKEEFGLRNGLIYLNHAAVSPWPARTAEAVRKFADDNLRNGSSNYPEWLQTEARLRRRAAKLMNAPSPDDIALLKNTSEALSVVAYGISWENGDNIITTDQEFPSNRIVWESLASIGVELREADLGGPDTPEDAIFALADERTRLITVSSVQFSTGLRLDLDLIGSFCQNREILFCVDAIQSLGALEMDIQKAGADFVMADGHKWMLGPEGLAIFYCSAAMRNRLKLHQYGWHMVEDHMNFDSRRWHAANTARRFECGSPNMIGIHALEASLSLLLETGMDKIERELLERTGFLIDEIKSQAYLRLITPADPDRRSGIVTFLHQQKDNEALFNYLSADNIFCALRGGGIRLSPHFYTPYEHIEKALNLISKY